MNPTTFDRVNPGDPLRISADTQNAIQRATEAVLNGTADPRDFARIATDAPGAMSIINGTGADIPPGTILAIDRPRRDPNDEAYEFILDPFVVGRTPVAGDDQAIVITQRPAKIADAVFGVVAGEAKCKVIINDEDDTRATFIPSDNTQMSSGTTGIARIMWKQDPADRVGGSAWCILNLDGGGGVSNTVENGFVVSSTASAVLNVWDYVVENDDGTFTGPAINHGDVGPGPTTYRPGWDRPSGVALQFFPVEDGTPIIFLIRPGLPATFSVPSPYNVSCVT